MNEKFLSILDYKLKEFRQWSSSQHLQDCRLVQYSGIECIGGITIPLAEAEREIEGLLSEGFGVAWAENKGQLFLLSFEPLNLPWNWPQVFKEEHLADPNADMPDFLAKI